MCLFVAISVFPKILSASQIELGVDVTGTHLHKIDEAPTSAGARFFIISRLRLRLEYYPSGHIAIRVDSADSIIFYGGCRFGTVHNFQPGIGLSYRF
jgi:hypothetical protein